MQLRLSETNVTKSQAEYLHQTDKVWDGPVSAKCCEGRPGTATVASDPRAIWPLPQQLLLSSSRGLRLLLLNLLPDSS